MKFLYIILLLLVCSVGFGDGIDPPFTPASVEISRKLLNDHEKRCDMIQDLADKSEMNYRYLAMKVMEKWQLLIKDKTFVTNFKKSKTVKFSVSEKGSIGIQPVVD